MNATGPNAGSPAAAHWQEGEKDCVVLETVQYLHQYTGNRVGSTISELIHPTSSARHPLSSRPQIIATPTPQTPQHTPLCKHSPCQRNNSGGDPALSHNPTMVVTLRHEAGSISVHMIPCLEKAVLTHGKHAFLLLLRSTYLAQQ